MTALIHQQVCEYCNIVAIKYISRSQPFMNRGPLLEKRRLPEIRILCTVLGGNLRERRLKKPHVLFSQIPE